MRGFVLINTIYMISLMALIILTLQSNMQLDIKIINNLSSYLQEMRDLEKSAIDIINDFEANSVQDNCKFVYDKDLFNYNNIIKNGCSVNNKIHYFITDLGEYTCLRVIINDNSFATHHYLLNIVSKNLFSKILQIRYVLPGSNSLCKNSIYRDISTGMLSWNMIAR